MVQDQGVGGEGGEGLGILKFYNFFSLKHSLSYLEPENQKSSKFWSFEKLLGGWVVVVVGVPEIIILHLSSLILRLLSFLAC